jgi:hypothetical protein
MNKPAFFLGQSRVEVSILDTETNHPDPKGPLPVLRCARDEFRERLLDAQDGGEYPDDLSRGARPGRGDPDGRARGPRTGLHPGRTARRSPRQRRLRENGGRRDPRNNRLRRLSSAGARAQRRDWRRQTEQRREHAGSRERETVVPPIRGGRRRRATTRLPPAGRRPWRHPHRRRRTEYRDRRAPRRDKPRGRETAARPDWHREYPNNKAKSPRQIPSPVNGKGNSPDARTGAADFGQAASNGKHTLAARKQPWASGRARRRGGPPTTLPEASRSARRDSEVARGRGLAASQEAARRKPPGLAHDAKAKDGRRGALKPGRKLPAGGPRFLPGGRRAEEGCRQKLVS